MSAPAATPEVPAWARHAASFVTAVVILALLAGVSGWVGYFLSLGWHLATRGTTP